MKLNLQWNQAGSVPGQPIFRQALRSHLNDCSAFVTFVPFETLMFTSSQFRNVDEFEWNLKKSFPTWWASQLWSASLCRIEALSATWHCQIARLLKNIILIFRHLDFVSLFFASKISWTLVLSDLSLSLEVHPDLRLGCSPWSVWTLLQFHWAVLRVATMSTIFSEWEDWEDVKDVKTWSFFFHFLEYA